MNKIYQDAIQNQKERGKPIFLTNIVIAKYQYFGLSKIPRKEYFFAKKIVASGTLEQMKKDSKLLLSCLVKLYGKEKAFKSDRTKFFIEDEYIIQIKDGAKTAVKKTDAIEIISFHGYSHHK